MVRGCPEPGRHGGRPQRKCPAMSAAGRRPFPHGRSGCHADRTPTMLTLRGGGRGLRSSGSGPVSGRAPHELPCPRGCRKAPTRVRAGGRRAGGGRTTVRAADRRRRQHGHQHQPGHLCRTPAVRTAVVPEAADGQSADGSGSLQLPLLFLKAGPAGGRLRRPSSAGSRHGQPTSQTLGHIDERHSVLALRPSRLYRQ
jgi:hypothetical protein